MSKPMGHLCDAAITMMLIVALLLGAPVWIVVGVYLALEVISHILKAFNAALSPVVEALKGRA